MKMILCKAVTLFQCVVLLLVSTTTVDASLTNVLNSSSHVLRNEDSNNQSHNQNIDDNVDDDMYNITGGYLSYDFFRRRNEETINPKLGHTLTTLINIHNTDGPLNKLDLLFLNSTIVSLLDYNTVLIDLIGNVDVLNGTGSENNNMQSLLLNDGYDVINCLKNICSMYVPIDQLVALANLTYVHYARPVVTVTRAGSVTSQGDNVIKGGFTRDRYGLNGSSLLIGVMSDSYNCLNGASEDISTNDLPSSNDIIIVSDFNSTECTLRGTDEGRFMMQIIHDVAPGARLAFRSAYRGEADFATGIRELAGIGCDIIVDDVGYAYEPFYQDGIISQAIDDVVTRGVLYFTAMGNEGALSWVAPNGFVRSGISDDNGEFHQFTTSSDGDPIIYQLITIPYWYLDVIFCFQWSEPFYSISGGSGSRSDLDIYVVFNNKTIAQGIDSNVGKDPVEVFSFNPATLEGAEYAFNVEVYIQLYSGSPPKHMQLICFDSNGYLVVYEYGKTPSSTGYGHVNSALGASIGGVLYYETPWYFVNPPKVYRESSYGGTPILFDTLGNLLPSSIIRKQPQVVGPVAVSTTGRVIFGTSAAASHVAALAALILQSAGRRTFSPAVVLESIQGSAIDMDLDGFDFFSGYGLVNAFLALLFSSEPTRSPTKSPTKPPVKTPVSLPTVAQVPVKNIPASRPNAEPVGPINKAPVTVPLMTPRAAPVQVPIQVQKPPAPAGNVPAPIPSAPINKSPVILPIAAPFKVPASDPKTPVTTPFFVPVKNVPVKSYPIPIAVPASRPVSVPFGPINETPANVPLTVPRAAPVLVPIKVIISPVPEKNVPVAKPLVPINKSPITGPINIPIPVLKAPISIPVDAPIRTTNVPVVSPPIKTAFPSIASPYAGPKTAPVKVPNTTPFAPITNPILVPLPVTNGTAPSPISSTLTAPVEVPVPITIPILKVPLPLTQPVPIQVPLSKPQPISSPMIKSPVPINNVPVTVPIMNPPISSKKRKMNNKY